MKKIPAPIQILCFLIACCVLFSPLVLAQEYEFIVVADSNTVIGNSTVNALFAAPAIEGDYVAFRTNHKTNGTPDGIWSYRISTGEFTQLAGLSTPVPGGNGTFANFGAVGSSLGGPALKNGMVVFGATDQGTNPSGFPPVGIFSVPVTGGAVNKIATYEDPAPGAPTDFFHFGEDSRNFGSVSHAEGVVVFEGTFGGGSIGGTGLYHSAVAGGAIEVLGDSNHPWNPLEVFPVKAFSNPATNGTGVALFGGTVFGVFGLFYSAIPSGGAQNFNLLVGPETPLPAATAPHDDTRFFLPSAQISGQRIGFIARDLSSGTAGMYVVNPSGTFVETIATNKSSELGIANWPDSGINTFSFAMNGSNTLFRVRPNHDEQSLFLKKSNEIVKVVDLTFTLNGIQAYDIGEVAPHALDGENFVFTYGTITFPRSVIVLARPKTEEEPGVQAEVVGLITGAQAQIPLAKKALPKGKKKADAKQAILAARAFIKGAVSRLDEIANSESSQVLQLTRENLKDLNKALKAGSRPKASSKLRKKSWKKVATILAEIGRE